jgi:hypothetical protein
MSEGALNRIAACLSALVTLPALGDEWPADPLARDAIAKNEATRARLGAFAVEMTVKRDDPSVTQTYRALLKYKGNWRYADWERPGLTGPFGRRIRAVLNDAYFAFTLGDASPLAYQHEWDGGPESTKTVRNWTETHLPADPLAFAFGDGYQTLREVMEVYRQHFKVAAEEATGDAGRRVVRLKVYRKEDDGPAHPTWDYDLDPGYGYAVTRMASRGWDAPDIEYRVEMQSAGPPDAWLPRRVRRTRYDGHSPGPRGVEEYEFKLLTGEDVSDGAFRANGLHLPQNQLLVRMPAGGKAGRSVMQSDGVWLPDSMVRFAVPIRGGPPVGGNGPKWPAICATAALLTGVLIVFTARRVHRRRT